MPAKACTPFWRNVNPSGRTGNIVQQRLMLHDDREGHHYYIRAACFTQIQRNYCDATSTMDNPFISASIGYTLSQDPSGTDRGTQCPDYRRAIYYRELWVGGHCSVY